MYQTAIAGSALVLLSASPLWAAPPGAPCNATGALGTTMGGCQAPPAVPQKGAGTLKSDLFSAPIRFTVRGTRANGKTGLRRNIASYVAKILRPHPTQQESALLASTGPVTGSGGSGGTSGFSSGSSYGGGLVGYNSGSSITDSYESVNFVAVGNASVTGATYISSLNNLQNTSPGAGTNWSWNSWGTSGFSNSNHWFNLPNGAPILVADMPTDTITANNASMTYTGSPWTGIPSATQSITFGGSAIPTSSITYRGNYQSGVNVLMLGGYTITPSSTLSAPTSQSSLGGLIFVNGTLTIKPAILTATANIVTVSPAYMTYEGTIPNLSGTLSGFVNGQTPTTDGVQMNWSTTATPSSPAGTYTVTGGVIIDSTYAGNYAVIQAPGNATALTIPVAPTVDNPVLQTVGNNQSLVALPELSSVATTANDSSSSSTPTSSTSSTLSETGNSSLKVIEPVDTGDVEILFVEKVTK